MPRLKKTIFEEVRVQVSISYDLNPNKTDDDKLLDLVEEISGFKVQEQQHWGCGAIPSGFIIFEGGSIPTKEQKQLMVTSVNEGLKKCAL